MKLSYGLTAKFRARHEAAPSKIFKRCRAKARFQYRVRHHYQKLNYYQVISSVTPERILSILTRLKLYLPLTITEKRFNVAVANIIKKYEITEYEV
jgi:hypothetical protein